VTDPHELDSQRGSYAAEFPFFEENRRALEWYAERVEGLASRSAARRALSLGIGQRIVCRRLAGALSEGRLDRYVIVEASSAAIGELVEDDADFSGCEVVEAWFESFSSHELFDLVEMGFVLEHVDDPLAILCRFRDLLTPAGVMAVAVPNACSLHRLIGHASGLLDDPYALSDADHALGHQRYFDRQSLRDVMAEAGLDIELEEGIFLKPLTTAQLAKLELPESVMTGLFRVAVGLPEIANALYVEAKRAG